MGKDVAQRDMKQRRIITGGQKTMEESMQSDRPGLELDKAVQLKKEHITSFCKLLKCMLLLPFWACNASNGDSQSLHKI